MKRMMIRSAVATAAIHLLSFALFVTVSLASENRYTISDFTCVHNWNPTILSNSRTQVKSICNMKLLVTAIQNKSSSPSVGTKTASVLLLVTAGAESLRTKNLVGVDYWNAVEKSVSLEPEGTTDIDMSNWDLVFPNICGQTYLICRLLIDEIMIDQPVPIQLKCREENVELGLVGQTKEVYDMTRERPVINFSDQPLTYFIPELKVWVKNYGMETFTARSGLSAFSVAAYLKIQQFNMYHYDIKNQNTGYQPDKQIFEYQLGDVLLNETDIVPVQGGRGTPSLANNYLLELNLKNLTLKSRTVCGNAVLVFQLKVSFQPEDSNFNNNFYIIPVFVNCYDNNPVHTTETCQVVPNYYDGGQTAYITYSTSEKTIVYEYKADDRSVRKMTEVEDKATIHDVAQMQLLMDTHSKRLMQLGQCVDTLYGSVDCFVTLLDAVLANIRNSFEEIVPENSVQRSQHSKMKLILGTICDLFTLMLQQQNPIHDYLHLPFQAIFSPYHPKNYGHYSNNYYESNRVKQDSNDINMVEHEFEAAAVEESRDRSIPMPTTSSPPLTAGQTVQHGNSSTETTANLPGTMRDSTPTTVTVTVPRTNTAAYTTAQTGYSQETTSIPKATVTSASFTSKSTAATPSLSTQVKTTLADATQSLTGTQRSSTTGYSDSSVEEEAAFGPKAKWHKVVADFIYDLITNGGENYHVLSKDRWHALSIMLKSLLFGRQEDFDRYPYIPMSLKQDMHTVVNMFAYQNGPRLFDNIPKPLIDTFSSWYNMKQKYRRNFGQAACDYDEGLSLVLNKTQELLDDTEMFRKHQHTLALLTNIIEVLTKDDNTNYYAQLNSKLAGPNRMQRVWMVRDDIPIGEPCKEDVCKRCTALKQWQFRKSPLFQFGSKTMSPDHYNAVYWTESNGSILRGDRSDLTGQVFWSKVATCSCPNGGTCSGSTTNSPATKRPMAAAVIKNEAEIAIEAGQTNSNQKQDIEAAEDMLFSD